MMSGSRSPMLGHERKIFLLVFLLPILLPKLASPVVSRQCLVQGFAPKGLYTSKPSQRQRSKEGVASKKSAVIPPLKQLCVVKKEEEEDDNLLLPDKGALNRRSLLLSQLLVASSLLSSPLRSNAVGTSSSASSTSYKYPPTTHKVRFSVRISRSDGTFYVRDDDDPLDTVFTGTIVLALFGTVAPNHVSQFLKYVSEAFDATTDAVPSYGRSVFTGLDQSDGLLRGGFIPGLEMTLIGGGDALQYGGRIVPAKLWIEADRTLEKLKHDMRGLLTHRALDLTPAFGITTREEPALDGTYIVFGRLLLDDENGDAFLRRCEEIKTYNVDRPVGGGDVSISENSNPVVEGLATSIFNGQREFFRGAAKTLGDTRLEKVYDGKFLRRVDVTRVELL